LPGNSDAYWFLETPVVSGDVSHLRLAGAELKLTRRRGINSHTTCPLGDQEDETADHISVGCVLARELWHNKGTANSMTHFGPG
jgi:hypothetical protein